MVFNWVYHIFGKGTDARKPPTIENDKIKCYHDKITIKLEV